MKTNHLNFSKINVLYFLSALLFQSYIINAQVHVNSTSQLSVGTTSHTQMFDILSAGSTTGTGLHMINSSALAVNNKILQSFTFNAGTHGEFGMLETSTSSSGLADFYWSTWNGSAFAERMRLTSDGNLGIGTSNAFQINSYKVLWNNGSTTDIFVGVNAGNSSMSGHNNTFVGNNAGNANSSGATAVAVGGCALQYNTTGNYNSAVGMFTLRSNTTGGYNCAFGYGALNTSTTTSENSAFGYNALQVNTGTYNAAFGARAMWSNTSGEYNTAVGKNSLFYNTTGSSNTAVGYGAGGSSSHATSTYMTYLGYNATSSADALTNSTIIGNGASVSVSNKVRIGNGSVTVIEGQVAWTSTSDGRFKNNIKEDVKGLDFIKKLRPVTYNFDTKKFDEFLMKNTPDSMKTQQMNSVDYSSSSSIVHTGFIAQEVEQAAKDCGYAFDGVHTPVNDNDNYGLAYSQLIVPLVKAVQEQQKMIDSLKIIANAHQAQITNCCSSSGLQGMKIINNGSNLSGSGSNSNGKENNVTGVNNSTTSDTKDILYQNIPNPFDKQSNIQYYISTTAQNASVMIFDLQGKLIKTVPVTNFGKGAITINGNELSPGMFVYSLIVDGNIVDTKRMILTQ